jgi:hypothetical protein
LGGFGGGPGGASVGIFVSARAKLVLRRGTTITTADGGDGGAGGMLQLGGLGGPHGSGGMAAPGLNRGCDGGWGGKGGNGGYGGGGLGGPSVGIVIEAEGTASDLGVADIDPGSPGAGGSNGNPLRPGPTADPGLSAKVLQL